MSVARFHNAKKTGAKLCLLTCYDYWSASLLAKCSLDGVLVGDSLAMVMHGHTSTIAATVEMMEGHISSVKRGAPNLFLIADLPFLSHRQGIHDCVGVVQRLMQAGAQAVKLEGGLGNEELVRYLVESGVPVMGHIGMTPQFVNQFGGFKVQGKSTEGQQHILREAQTLEAAGCFSLVIECVPAALAQEITATVRIPTIGIGAGSCCDGQILVLQDIWGVWDSEGPRFVRKYFDGRKILTEAVENYMADVKSGTFPSKNESYL